MKLNRGLIWFFVIIAVLIAVKFLFFPSGDAEGMKQGPAGPPPATNVEGYVTKYEPLDHSLQVTGTVLPNESVDLRPEISGKVEALPLREGSIAEKGSLLVKLNDKDLQAQLKKITAQKNLSDARLKRLDQLLKVQGVSQQEYDETSNEVAALEADADVLRVMISRTEIRAPFKGMVGLRSVSIGSYVTPADVIAGIKQMDPVRIEFSIPGRYSALIEDGMEIQFSMEGESESRKGTVYAIESGIDQETRMLVIRARASNPDHKVKPGSFVKVNMILDRLNEAILIPTQAIVPVLKGQQVFVSKNGKAEPVKVTLGLREEKRVQITEGLKAGDTVVVTGVMSVRPGTLLKWSNFR
jgi:membrane fusion protein, multidrug efflux system